MWNDDVRIAEDAFRGGTPLICRVNPSPLAKVSRPSLFWSFFWPFFWTGFSWKMAFIFIHFETKNANFPSKVPHGTKPCEKRPTCVSTGKNAYETHVGPPPNAHKFMTNRSKALSAPLLKTNSFLKTIFNDFWPILTPQNVTPQVDRSDVFLTFN